MWHTKQVASWEPLPVLDRAQFINSGGVGEVFRDTRSPTRCVKRFFKPLVDDQARQLAHLIDVASWARPSEQHILESRLSWPLVGYGSPDRIEGFSMTYAPDDAKFEIRIAGKQRKVLLQANYLINDKFWKNNRALTSVRPNVEEQDRVSIAAEFLDAMETIHRHDLVYGDVSGNNICVRLGEFPSVFVLDADSIVSPELRQRNLVKTPDWDPYSSSMDSMSADRSLTALFIWRLLAEAPRACPSIKEARNLPGVVGTNCGLLLTEMYETGSITAANELGVAIRASRTPARVEKSYTRAVRTGYARFVINEMSTTMSKDQLGMVAKAERFVQLEEEVERTTGSRQRRLINKIGTLDFPFVFDLNSVALVGAPPASIADLRKMLQDAEFSEVAQHLAVSGLGNLESHWMVSRALKHAYVQMGDAAFAARAKAEHGVISWRWPSVRYINVVRLEFSKDGYIVLDDEVERDFMQASTDRSLSVPGGGDVTAVLRFGTRSPSGKSFWVEGATRLKFAVPAPPKVATSSKTSAQVTLVDSQSLALQQQLEEDLERLASMNRAKIRRNRLAAGIGGGLAAAAAAITLLLVLPTGRTTDMCQIPQLSSLAMCGDNQIGAIDVSDRFGRP